jgi:lysophospholipase L1-like esterase
LRAADVPARRAETVSVRILCYGDSNTWGFSPRGGFRFPPGVRWPGVLGRCLGPGASILEEGLNGRTLLSFGPPGHPLNGGEHLPVVLEANQPLDGLLLFLGTNDLFAFEDLSVEEMADGLLSLLTRVTVPPAERDARKLPARESAGAERSVGESAGRPLPPDRVVVMPPVSVHEEIGAISPYRRQLELSRQLPDEYRRIAGSRGCLFFDPGRIITASALDGVHLEAEAHISLGESLCDFLRARFEMPL